MNKNMYRAALVLVSMFYSTFLVADVKIKKGLFGGGIISDKRYVVILLGPEIAGENSSEVIAIWADHIGLAGFARQYFEYLLKDSKKV